MVRANSPPPPPARGLAPLTRVACGCGQDLDEPPSVQPPGPPLAAGLTITRLEAIHRSTAIVRRDARTPGTLLHRLLDGSPIARITGQVASGGPAASGTGLVYDGAEMILHPAPPHRANALVTAWGEGKPPFTDHFGLLVYRARLSAERLTGLKVGIDLRLGRVSDFRPSGAAASLIPLPGRCRLIHPHD
jgi:hypothetical protein